jgi:hypothetical protein
MAQPMGHQAPYNYLEEIRGKVWRWDLKALVGSVLLGVLLTVVNAVLERIDAALTGGAFVILGAIGFATFTALSTLFFRLPGGFITGEVNALISTATAASPMSPWFFPANALFPIAYALIAWKLPMTRWWHHLLANGAGMTLTDVPILIGLLVTLKLPLGVALVSFVVTTASGIVGSTILTVLIARAVARSRVLG